MAITLTQPFISKISPQGVATTIYPTVNVLGGDLIDRIYWELDDINGNQIASGSQVVTDTLTESIRSFQITASGFTLVANTTYLFSAYTQNTTNNVSTNSAWSEAALFNCYVTPTIGLYQLVGTTETPISAGDTFTVQPFNVGVTFDRNDLQSPAVLSYSIISLLDSSGNEVYSVKTYGRNAAAMYGMAPNATYKLQVVSYTADGLMLTKVISNLSYSATAPTGDVTISAQNNCANGTIELSCTVSDFSMVLYFEIQRQEQGSVKWLTLCTVPSASFAYGTFNFTDRLAGSNRVYNYRLVLFSAGGIQTVSDTAEVLSQFSNVYICDGNESYKLTNQWTQSGDKTVFKSALYEPYGSKYPIVVNNAVLGYDAGTTTATVLAPTTEANYKIDRFAEVNLANRFAAFLTNRKPKVLKDFNGNLRIISLQSDVSRNYVRELGNGICSTSFSWVQISDFEQSNISEIGLLNVATIDTPSYPIVSITAVGITNTNNQVAIFAGSTYTNTYISSAQITEPHGYMNVNGTTITYVGDVYSDGNLFYGEITIPNARGEIRIVVNYA